MIDTKDCWLKDSCKQLHCTDPNGCLILFKLDYLYNQANVPLALRKKLDLKLDADGTDYEQFQMLKNIQDNIVDFVNNGNQLLIHSVNCGSGKTSWALRLLQTYFNKIWLTSSLSCKALFIDVPTFLLAAKSNITAPNEYFNHIMDNVMHADLVIFDDIGTKNSTVFEHEHLFSIINNRLAANKTNIYTSNLTDAELQQALGARLASRICNTSFNIWFEGGDKRHLGRSM